MSINWVDATTFAPSPDYHGVKFIVKVVNVNSGEERLVFSFIDYEQGGWATCCNDIKHDDCIVQWAFIADELQLMHDNIGEVNINES